MDEYGYPKELMEKLNDPQLLDKVHGGKAFALAVGVWVVLAVIAWLVT